MKTVDDFLFAGFRNGVIRKYDLKTGECCRVFCGHHTPVFEIHVISELFSFISSADDGLRLWSYNEAEVEQVQTRPRVNSLYKSKSLPTLPIEIQPATRTASSSEERKQTLRGAGSGNESLHFFF